MTTEKSAWQRPELIVLVRSRPEEAVLAGCKIPSANSGPSRHNCKEPTGPGNCVINTTS